jgi:hypothetical protein
LAADTNDNIPGLFNHLNSQTSGKIGPTGQKSWCKDWCARD